MKFILIGLHGSGKHEIAHQLQEMGVMYGKNFSNTPPNSTAYGEYEVYDNQDITDIFENNAYIYMHEHCDEKIANSYKYFEGLSKYTYDNNNVFVMSPDQFMSISANNFPKDAIWVWLDNTKSNRQTRHKVEKRNYEFVNREILEKNDIKEFVKTLYNEANSNILYFTNEEPCRVATIIYTIIQHPELLSIYIKNFN